MNFIKKSFVIAALLIIVFLPVFVFAQNSGGNPPDTSGSGGNPPAGENQTTTEVTTIKNPINVDTIDGLIKKILEGVIKIGIPIVALAIIYSGFLFVSAQGKSEKLEEAKRALMYSVIGAAILLGSWAIAQIISETVLAL